MGFIHGANRHEELRCPERLDDSMAEEHPIRFLDACVDPLILPTLGFQRATPAATGRPAYHPADLVTLSIYGYLDRLQTSRRLATAENLQRGVLRQSGAAPDCLQPLRGTSDGFRRQVKPSVGPLTDHTTGNHLVLRAEGTYHASDCHAE